MMEKYRKGRILCDIEPAIEHPYNVLAQQQTQSNEAVNTRIEYGSGGNKEIGGKKKYKSKKEETINLPNIEKIYSKIRKCIIGQDVAVKKIITAIYRTIKFPSLKSNILIIGSSGVGKTETIKQIANRLNIPYTIEDATKYTKEGYYGADVEDMIYNLISNAKNNLAKAKHGIIVIDEIDKKISKEISGDISGTDVLNSLLKIIEGTTLKLQIKQGKYEYKDVDFDTSNLTIILMGAFQGLDKIRDKRLNTKLIGFKSDNFRNNLSFEFTKQDLVKYGMPEEFVGRITSLVQMKTLEKEDFMNILKYSEISTFRKYENELRKKGIILKYKQSLFDSIVNIPMNQKYGVRELNSIVDSIFENIIYDIMNSKYNYKECLLMPEIVYDNTQYVLS